MAYYSELAQIYQMKYAVEKGLNLRYVIVYKLPLSSVSCVF